MSKEATHNVSATNQIASIRIKRKNADENKDMKCQQHKNHKLNNTQW